ncbi:TPA: helix-turn-helix domain-containing protein [Mannheimia haemolytica]|uniref:Helix-turn-helix domain-containing protein n=1 Tax=Mannheimia haemolytica TaxID=75985 RepID=A0A547EAB9_MANHA|nr:S24 family peptidase [Mannheimia haemolytica]AWW71062.1 phage repressor protein [Pasteurellaceae bacterium 12565]AGI32180.2 phage repressor protein [Mannheimia haemolytica USDA-ARS-USMARC-183]AGK02991.1 transcriptional repressor protein C2 [Mannheimia haemolytica M42548]AGQ24397.1 repressor [Mannheimia haemolytica D153]AGQ39933.1 repressor [Mannheimia haemolytica D174]
MNTQTLGDRIKSRRKELKLTQKDLATALKGVSHVAVSQWESSTTKPNSENILDLSTVLQCDISWLLRGNGESNVLPASLGMTKVPLISYIQAGQWTGIDDFRETCGDYEYILTDLEVSEDAFALEIKGDSMEPDFIEGDRVIIDPDVQPHAGEFVAAINGDYEATFKKYRPLEDLDEYGRQHFELIALNPDYHKLSTLKQEIRIIGTMVEHRIYRRKR